MKTFFVRLSLIVFVFASMQITAQTMKSIMHDDLNRKYIEYIPSSYTGSEAVPLVIALHGLGDTITNFQGVGFQVLGEMNNFITVYPQGMQGYAGTAWNAGVQYYSIVINSAYDDVDFIRSLIDTLSANYNIDPARIYVTGFSMGGFMANRLACELSDVIAAVAAVAGTRGNVLPACQPWRPVPYCHFHGTEDQTVYYTGNLFGMDTEDLILWWSTFNQTDAVPTITQMPDNAADSIIVYHLDFPNGLAGSTVEFYKAENADHEWLYTPVNDVSYTILIWDFFSKHQLVNLDIEEPTMDVIYLYPSIADEEIFLSGNNTPGETTITMYTIQGAVASQFQITNLTTVINTTDLPSGIYIWEATNNDQMISKGKLVISH